MVTREELLATVWEGVVVTDGSLKRAVSLLRAALREGGAEEAVRTLARQGYRFCAEDVQEVAVRLRPQRRRLERLDPARRAHAEDRWTDAAEAFAAADAGDALGGARPGTLGGGRTVRRPPPERSGSAGARHRRPRRRRRSHGA